MFEPQIKDLEAEFSALTIERKSLAKFALGKVCASKGASEAFKKAEVSPYWFIAKHQEGDWGDISEFDKARNNSAVRDGFFVLSAHILPKTGEKILIVTESDRSATTLLLPEEF